MFKIGDRVALLAIDKETGYTNPYIVEEGNGLEAGSLGTVVAVAEDYSVDVKFDSGYFGADTPVMCWISEINFID